jgi:histidyl-tRNA synthetase
MFKINTQVMSGFMELLPDDQLLFNSMLDTIRTSYERFGFIPLDTPVIERAEVLFAKAGEETEKQIYRIDKGETPQALRFDLTVPLARYVSDHMNELTFPFRRYHIGKVYRGERAQKGRYREFYQCDIDIIGNEQLNLINDAEILSVINATFTALNIGTFTIRINNRKVLNGFFAGLGAGNQMTTILRIIDKLEKMGRSKVTEELAATGIAADVIEKILTLVALRGAPTTVLPALAALDVSHELFTTGVQELTTVTKHVEQLGIPMQNYELDLSIARGLDYYTGTVYETTLNAFPQIGSICSGGRYDNLAESFCNKKLPGVGISIGFTRLFSQLREHGIITPGASTTTKVLVIPLLDNLTMPLAIATQLRTTGINTEVYLETAKIKKKLDYANKLSISYVILVGEDEIKADKYTVKDMKTGEQVTVSRDALIPHINKQ